MTLDKNSYVKLSDGNKIPMIGLGTYCPDEVQKSKCEEAIKVAIELGFCLIDGAFVYGNEEEIGRGINAKIADGTVKREELFYTGKLWGTFHRPELVRTSLEDSLKKLKLDYMDLFLIHMPFPLKPGADPLPKDESGKLVFDDVDLCQTWKAMESCKDAGLVKSIGVSNFNQRLLEKILNKPGLKYKPVLNQVECHPYLKQAKLLSFCKSKDIVLEAFSALGSQRDEAWMDTSTPVLREDPVLVDLAKKHNRSPALIALRYQLQRGIVVLAKSFTKKHIKENLQNPKIYQPDPGAKDVPSELSNRVVFDFQLPEEDMKTLNDLKRNVRYMKLTGFASHPNYAFTDE